jgi:hypothetical protein
MQAREIILPLANGKSDSIFRLGTWLGENGINREGDQSGEGWATLHQAPPKYLPQFVSSGRQVPTDPDYRYLTGV